MSKKIICSRTPPVKFSKIIPVLLLMIAQIAFTIPFYAQTKAAGAAVKSLLYAALKDKENTLRSLEEAYQQRLAGVLYIQFPHYDFLKDEPRYQELLRKINFPK